MSHRDEAFRLDYKRENVHVEGERKPKQWCAVSVTVVRATRRPSGERTSAKRGGSSNS
jgi:hypothetical protein